MKHQKRTTIYDIAKKLNLNASSVSRALNNSIKVSERTRNLIIETAKELNYKPNNLASNLRKGANQTIGVIVPRINQNFFADIIAGIEEVTYEKGYSLIICQSNESHLREIECVNTLIHQHVNCIMISVSADFNDNTHLKNIGKHGIQLIQFDRVTDLDTFKVVNDNEKASFEAVTHLIEQGYKRIALLEGPQNLGIFRQRKAGYLAALKENNIPILPELIIENAWTQELGATATRKLLSLPIPPDAIFASTSDFSALGVLEVATRMSVKVPEALGICGYSNEAFSAITSPSITTVDQYCLTMGKTVANLYFQGQKSGTQERSPQVVSIQPKLITRNSTLRKFKI